MTVMTKLHAIVQELDELTQRVPEQDFKPLIDAILAAGHIFIAGAGRSGFMARAFTNRLMHLGLKVSFVGEPSTPSIHKNDLLFIASGSGETASLVAMAKKAQKQGATLATLTLFPQATIGQTASVVVQLPGYTTKSSEQQGSSIQPMGSAYEQLSLLFMDSVVLALMERTGQTEAEMFARHANLE